MHYPGKPERQLVWYPVTPGQMASVIITFGPGTSVVHDAKLHVDWATEGDQHPNWTTDTAGAPGRLEPWTLGTKTYGQRLEIVFDADRAGQGYNNRVELIELDVTAPGGVHFTPYMRKA